MIWFIIYIVISYLAVFSFSFYMIHTEGLDRGYGCKVAVLILVSPITFLVLIFMWLVLTINME